jgi:MYXO-CTERM domain-containing protein
VLLADDARAAVNQPPPGNEPMPVPTGMNEWSIWTSRGFPMDAGTLAGLFKYHAINVNGVMTAGGDITIDPVRDARTTPGAFSPQCGLSGTIVLRGGGCKNALGWYNTTENATTPPPANQIYQLVPANLQLAPPMGLMCMDGDFCPLATRITTQVGQHTWTDVDFASNIRMDRNWAGGLIGLAMIGVAGSQCTQTKYSQAQLNDKSPGGMPWVTTLIYQSVADPQSYYIAFEDLPTCSTSWKGCNGSTANDGDFNDFVFYVTGLTCNLGGMPCTVASQMGICANGVTECAEGGTTTTCRQAVMPAAEKCDAVDNDCNGVVDEGDNLCPTGEVCAEGKCVHPCDDGEFKCAVGYTCDVDGLCKDPRCIGKTCGAGQVCVAGICVGGCDGVTCPHGQVCRLGNCVAPCEGVMCPTDRICEGGACQPKCGACRSCQTGFSCNMTSGVCFEAGCENKTCAAGQVCKPPGNCVDGCEGVTCPGGQECKMGSCTAIPLPDGGVPPTTGTGGTGIVITGRAGSTGTGGGVAGSTGSGGSGIVGTGGTTTTPPKMIQTCKCDTAEGPGTAGIALLLAAFAIAVGRRRRPSAIRRR